MILLFSSARLDTFLRGLNLIFITHQHTCYVQHNWLSIQLDFKAMFAHLSLFPGSSRRSFASDRRWFLGWYGTSSSLMYLGASPLSALYTSSRTLNWMWNLIGSQWSLMRTVVISSYFLVLDTILALLFCNPWSIAIIYSCSANLESIAIIQTRRYFCGIFC